MRSIRCSSRRASYAAALLSILLLAACGSDISQMPRVTPEISAPIDAESSVAPAAAAVTVEIRDRAFGGEAIEDAERPVVVIGVGSEVTFTNFDDPAHVIVEGFDGQPAPEPLFTFEFDEPGQSDSYTFSEAGTYMVTCTIHPQMTLEVVVS